MLLHLSCLPEQVPRANKDIRSIFGETRSPRTATVFPCCCETILASATLGRQPLLRREGIVHIPPTADRRRYTIPPSPSIKGDGKGDGKGARPEGYMGNISAAAGGGGWMDGVTVGE